MNDIANPRADQQGHSLGSAPCNTAPSNGLGKTKPRLVGRGKAINPSDPMAAARKVHEQHYVERDTQLPILHFDGQWYEFEHSHYRTLTDVQMRNEVWRLLEIAKKVKSTETEDGDVEEELVKVVPTPKMVSAIIDALRSVSKMPHDVEAPAWLAGGDGYAPGDILPVRNGLLHVPSRKLLPATPAFFCTTASDIRFDPDAKPVLWLEFLKQVFGDDPEGPRLIQEWMGYCLTKDASFQKILAVKGPPRSGKGTIIKMIEFLLGAGNYTATSLDELSDTGFGRQPLIGKRLAILPDVRFSSRTDQERVAQQLLSISGDDTTSIKRKFMSNWNGRLPIKFMIVTNDTPEFRDSSGALMTRFVVACTMNSFVGREDLKLESKLIPELPGILNWALDGHERLYGEKRFTQPEASRKVMQEMRDKAQPVQKFLHDMCVLGEGSVNKQLLHKELRGWWHKERLPDKLPTFAELRGVLEMSVPDFKESIRPREGEDRGRHYGGLRLKTAEELRDDEYGD